GLYFLVPFLLMLDVLLLEVGLVARHRGVIRTAMAAPLGLLAMALVGPEEDQVYQDFLALFRGQLGCTPLFFALLASAVFYALALVRRVPEALGALTLALLALAVVGPSTPNLDGLKLASPQPQPILALGVLQLWLGWSGRQSVRCLGGAACLVAGLTLSLGK